MAEDYDYDIDYHSESVLDHVYGDYGDYFVDNLDYTLKDLWNDCLSSTLYDGFSSSSKLILCCIFLKFNFSFSFLPETFHWSSFLTGLYCLHSFFGNDILYIILFACVGYAILLLANEILKQYQGLTAVFTCFSFLIVCELFFAEKTLWHRIRGSQMLLSMKLISLAFDTTSSEREIPSVSAMFGYLFHPGTVIFGPWVSYSTYLKSKENRNISISWISSILKSLLFSFSFLTLSTCWTSWIFYLFQWKWVNAYRDALSFRSSHYFVSYMSEATALISGLQITTVTSAFDIEVPRSLVEVVIWWNVPMHHWLKTYVFKTAKPLGNFTAVLLTYAASSLLHGLNFQLAAVLLSLGFYTYIEYVLRKQLASIFSACILARKCKPNCGHTNTDNHLYVLAANVAFGILAMFHLAYLGVMFDSSSDLEEEGYSMQHTLSKWKQLDFGSHWVAAFCYVIYWLL